MHDHDPDPVTSSTAPPERPDPTKSGIEQLIELIDTLRGPRGCPWDRKQTFQSTRANLLEEAHELATAIDDADPAAIGEELGDLLFQVAFVASLADSQNEFDLDQVARDVTSKMVGRHPHVFERDPSEPELTTDEIKRQWQRQKQSEKVLQSPAHGETDSAAGAVPSVLDGVPASLPPTTAAYRMTEKAAGLGFDWPSKEGVVTKIREELGEVEQLLKSNTEAGQDDELRERLAGELGDLLFSVINLARHLDCDPDSALARTNRKFRRRFQAVEQGIVESNQTSLEAMETLWQRAKQSERQ